MHVAAAIGGACRTAWNAFFAPDVPRPLRGLLTLGFGFVFAAPSQFRQSSEAGAAFAMVGLVLTGGCVGGIGVAKARSSLNRRRRWFYGTPVVLTSAVAPGTVLIYLTHSGLPAVGIANTGVALTGSWAALTWAKRLADLGLAPTEFVRATTTIRGLGVAWLIGIATGAAAGALHLLGLQPNLEDARQTLWALLGAAAAVLYAGPGYSEYVEAREKAIATARDEPETTAEA